MPKEQSNNSLEEFARDGVSLEEFASQKSQVLSTTKMDTTLPKIETADSQSTGVKQKEFKQEPKTFSVEQNRGQSIPINQPKRYDISDEITKDVGKEKAIDKARVQKNLDNILALAEDKWQTPGWSAYLKHQVPVIGETLEEQYPDNDMILRVFNRNIATMSKEERIGLKFQIEKARIPDDAKEQMFRILDKQTMVSSSMLRDDKGKESDFLDKLMETPKGLLQDIALGIHRHTKGSLLFATAGLMDVQKPGGKSIEDWWKDYFYKYRFSPSTEQHSLA